MYICMCGSACLGCQLTLPACLCAQCDSQYTLWQPCWCHEPQGYKHRPVLLARLVVLTYWQYFFEKRLSDWLITDSYLTHKRFMSTQRSVRDDAAAPAASSQNEVTQYFLHSSLLLVRVSPLQRTGTSLLVLRCWEGPQEPFRNETTL